MDLALLPVLYLNPSITKYSGKCTTNKIKRFTYNLRKYIRIRKDLNTVRCNAITVSSADTQPHTLLPACLIYILVQRDFENGSEVCLGKRLH